MGLVLMRRCKELALLESSDETPSMGALFRAWASHPLKKYLDDEGSIRFDWRMEADPRLYKTPFDDLSDKELDNYAIWYKSKPPDEVDRLSVEEQYQKWRVERKRFLPILPGAKPFNQDDRRLYNKKGGSSPKVSKKAKEKKNPSKISQDNSSGPLQIEESEIH